MKVHTSRDVHDEHECWIPAFVEWAEGRVQTPDFRGREVPERVLRLLTQMQAEGAR